MYKTYSNYSEIPKFRLSSCDTCQVYSCPYYSHASLYQQNFSSQFNNDSNGVDRKIEDFISTLNNQGFIVQEGKVSYVDIIKLCSEGKVDSCLGNNVGAPYAACFLPPAPNQNPTPGQQHMGRPHCFLSKNQLYLRYTT